MSNEINHNRLEVRIVDGEVTLIFYTEGQREGERTWLTFSYREARELGALLLNRVPLAETEGGSSV